MFPLRDSQHTYTIPVINFLLIGVTIVAFFLQLVAPDFEEFVIQYGFIPARFDLTSLDTYPPIIYSIFLHGGIFHIASNLWFLHIFGDNVEDRFGHIRYLFFYLATGIAAVFTQYVFFPAGTIPMIGASGAISGVAGAYFMLFKHSRIEALVPIGFFIHVAELPSWFFLGYWFVLQFFSGVGSLVTYDMTSGGVAYFAHIGGFLAGVIIARFFSSR